MYMNTCTWPLSSRPWRIYGGSNLSSFRCAAPLPCVGLVGQGGTWVMEQDRFWSTSARLCGCVLLGRIVSMCDSHCPSRRRLVCDRLWRCMTCFKVRIPLPPWHDSSRPDLPFPYCKTRVKANMEMFPQVWVQACPLVSSTDRVLCD